jgi:hypothetical protein
VHTNTPDLTVESSHGSIVIDLSRNETVKRACSPPTTSVRVRGRFRAEFPGKWQPCTLAGRAGKLEIPSRRRREQHEAGKLIEQQSTSRYGGAEEREHFLPPPRALAEESTLARDDTQPRRRGKRIQHPVTDAASFSSSAAAFLPIPLRFASSSQCCFPVPIAWPPLRDRNTRSAPGQ